MPKQTYTCSNPDCSITFERYSSTVRGRGVYCSHRCRSMVQSVNFLGENNPNYKGGINLGRHCDCGARKHIRAKKCTKCVDRSYAIYNLDASQDFETIFCLGERRQNQRVIKAIRRLDLMPYQCVECKSGTEWNGKPLTLQLDHINGNPLDNRIENLRFLCPNCHSQTDTWGYKKGES